MNRYIYLYEYDYRTEKIIKEKYTIKEQRNDDLIYYLNKRSCFQKINTNNINKFQGYQKITIMSFQNLKINEMLKELFKNYILENRLNIDYTICSINSYLNFMFDLPKKDIFILNKKDFMIETVNKVLIKDKSIEIYTDENQYDFIDFNKKWFYDENLLKAFANKENIKLLHKLVFEDGNISESEKIFAKIKKVLVKRDKFSLFY